MTLYQLHNSCVPHAATGKLNDSPLTASGNCVSCLNTKEFLGTPLVPVPVPVCPQGPVGYWSSAEHQDVPLVIVTDCGLLQGDPVWTFS